MTADASWVPPGIDTSKANVARVYDYWLGGSHNFLADQDVGRANRGGLAGVGRKAGLSHRATGRPARPAADPGPGRARAPSG